MFSFQKKKLFATKKKRQKSKRKWTGQDQDSNNSNNNKMKEKIETSLSTNKTFHEMKLKDSFTKNTIQILHIYS